MKVFNIIKKFIKKKTKSSIIKVLFVCHYIEIVRYENPGVSTTRHVHDCEAIYMGNPRSSFRYILCFCSY